jgi:hypothetical protein
MTRTTTKDPKDAQTGAKVGPNGQNKEIKNSELSQLVRKGP